MITTTGRCTVSAERGFNLAIVYWTPFDHREMVLGGRAEARPKGGPSPAGGRLPDQVGRAGEHVRLRRACHKAAARPSRPYGLLHLRQGPGGTGRDRAGPSSSGWRSRWRTRTTPASALRRIPPVCPRTSCAPLSCRCCCGVPIPWCPTGPGASRTMSHGWSAAIGMPATARSG